MKLIAEIMVDLKRVEVSLDFSLNARHEEIAKNKGIVDKQKEELVVRMTIVDQFKIVKTSIESIV